MKPSCPSHARARTHTHIHTRARKHTQLHIHAHAHRTHTRNTHTPHMHERTRARHSLIRWASPAQYHLTSDRTVCNTVPSALGVAVPVSLTSRCVARQPTVAMSARKVAYLRIVLWVFLLFHTPIHSVLSARCRRLAALIHRAKQRGVRAYALDTTRISYSPGHRVTGRKNR